MKSVEFDIEFCWSDFEGEMGEMGERYWCLKDMFTLLFNTLENAKPLLGVLRKSKYSLNLVIAIIITRGKHVYPRKLKNVVWFLIEIILK